MVYRFWSNTQDIHWYGFAFTCLQGYQSSNSAKWTGCRGASKKLITALDYSREWRHTHRRDTLKLSWYNSVLSQVLQLYLEELLEYLYGGCSSHPTAIFSSNHCFFKQVQRPILMSYIYNCASWQKGSSAIYTPSSYHEILMILFW